MGLCELDLCNAVDGVVSRSDVYIGVRKPLLLPPALALAIVPHIAPHERPHVRSLAHLADPLMPIRCRSAFMEML